MKNLKNRIEVIEEDLQKKKLKDNKNKKYKKLSQKPKTLR